MDALAWHFGDFGAGRRAGSMDRRCGLRAGSCVPLFPEFPTAGPRFV